MVKKTNHVVKSNDLNELMIDEIKQESFTPLEMKLFLTMVSLVRKDDEELCSYEVNVRDFGELIDTKHRDVRKQIHTAGERLMRKIIRFRQGKSTVSVALLSSLKTTEDKAAVVLKFDPNLRPELVKLSERFTSYTLQNITAFKSTQSIRLYELLVQYKAIGEREIELNELKKMLMVKETAYKKTAHFRLYVVEKAADEINELSDLQVYFEQRKCKKQVMYSFSIKSKNIETAPVEKKKIDLKPEQRDLLESLAAAQVKGTDISSDDYLSACIEYAQSQSKPIKHLAKYLQKCLLEDFPGLLKNKKDNSKKITTQKVQKTGFHLPESRGKDYTNAELEKILLGRKKAKKEAEKDG